MLDYANDPHECLRNLIRIDDEIARQTKARAILDDLIAKLRDDRERNEAVVYHAARQSMVSDGAILEGPELTHWSMNAGRITRVEPVRSRDLCWTARVKAVDDLASLSAAFEIQDDAEAETTVTCGTAS